MGTTAINMRNNWRPALTNVIGFQITCGNQNNLREIYVRYNKGPPTQAAREANTLECTV